MARPKVVVFAPATETHPELDEAGCEIVIGAASWADPTGDSQGKLVGMAAHADALVGTSIKGSGISRQVMMASETLRIVAKYTVGVDEIDIDAATELGIVVTHAPTEANWGGVVESTMTYMLAMLKKTRERDTHLKTGGAWRENNLVGTYVGRREDGYEGLTIGIIGLGRIGSRLSRFLTPWNVRMVGHDPYVSDEHFASLGVERVPLETLLRESDVVTLHVVLTKETRHMIDAASLRLMKPNAILINTSRGPAIDEPALIEALQAERIAGAALDVFETEPLPADSPLRSLGDRVIITPDMAANNKGAGLKPGIVWGTNDVLHALRGEVPEHVFNPDVLPRWRERFEGRSAL